mgnify:CR=1 FL=1
MRRDFILVSSALSKARAGIGSRFKTVVFLYMLSTLLAAVIAVIGNDDYENDLIKEMDKSVF